MRLSTMVFTDRSQGSRLHVAEVAFGAVAVVCDRPSLSPTVLPGNLLETVVDDQLRGLVPLPVALHLWASSHSVHTSTSALRSQSARVTVFQSTITSVPSGEFPAANRSYVARNVSMFTFADAIVLESSHRPLEVVPHVGLARTPLDLRRQHPLHTLAHDETGPALAQFLVGR